MLGGEKAVHYFGAEKILLQSDGNLVAVNKTKRKSRVAKCNASGLSIESQISGLAESVSRKTFELHCEKVSRERGSAQH